MALYVRLQSSFYTHRKTAKLQALLGTDALWIVPRLWCYACTNQPDGDFASYSPEELALLIGYNKDAKSMLKALQQAGYLDGMKIHDWAEHNEYHSTFSQRAVGAANARWDKDRSEKKGQDKKGKEQAWLKHATSIDVPKSLQSEHFTKAWTSWFAHRKEIRKPVTKQSATMTLRKLEAMGPQRALSAIEHSISNGWQGIFEPMNNGQRPLAPLPKKSEEPKEWKSFLKTHPKIAEVDPVWSRAQDYIKQEFYAWNK